MTETMTIRRILILPSRLAPIDESRLVSSSWTEDESDLSVDALLVPDEADSTWVDVMVEARVDGADVDWAASEACRRQLPWEREILLLPMATVFIQAVYTLEAGSARRATKIDGHPLEGKAIAGTADRPSGPP